MDLVQYEPQHLLQIEPQNWQQGEKPALAPSAAVTIMDNGDPVAIFGLFFVATGVLHIWAILSEAVREKPIEFHKSCMKLLALTEEQHKPQRIQTDVREDYHRGQKWLEALGFAQEGLMRGYGASGSNHYLYARVPEWQP